MPDFAPLDPEGLRDEIDKLTSTETFNDHSARHEPGGADAMAVDAASGTGSLRTLGDGATQAAAGNHGHADMVESEDVDHIVVLTQAAHDALDPADPDTLYVVVD